MKIHGKYLTAPARQRVKEAWLAGRSGTDIAAEHDVSPAAIYAIVKGIKRDNGPRRGARRSFSYAKARELHLKHSMTMDEIAYRLGVSRMSILRAVQEVRHAA